MSWDRVTVCARLKPEKRDGDDGDGDAARCIEKVDDENVTFKDETQSVSRSFQFNKVFDEDSSQEDVYEFLAWPIVQGIINAADGTIITYGEAGTGKTFSMEGPGITPSNDREKGIVSRLVEDLFNRVDSSEGIFKYTIKFSMVEIFEEKVRFVSPKRDLYKSSNDDLQIEKSETGKLSLPGMKENPISDPSKALKLLSERIAKRSNRSHCVYIFTVKRQLTTKRSKGDTGILLLVDLAGSEKVDNNGGEGRVLEEATINKSLLSLKNVMSALESNTDHNLYDKSKLTQMLELALGDHSRIALLCCCSPRLSNAADSLSTLQFGESAMRMIKNCEGKGFPNIKMSKEVDFRTFNNHDLPYLKAWIADPDVTAAYCPWVVIKSDGDCKKYLNRECIRDKYCRAICYRGIPIGEIAVTRYATTPFRCEIGYAIAQPFWGRGIGTRAIQEFLKKLFEDLEPVKRVQAIVDVENSRSQNLLVRCKFKEEGILRSYYDRAGELRDMVMYSLLRSDLQ